MIYVTYDYCKKSWEYRLKPAYMMFMKHEKETLLITEW